MFLAPMRHENVTVPRARRASIGRLLGYLISIVSVFFLGAAAWPKENPPTWLLSGAHHWHGDVDHRHGLPLPRAPRAEGEIKKQAEAERR